MCVDSGVWIVVDRPAKELLRRRPVSGSEAPEVLTLVVVVVLVAVIMDVDLVSWELGIGISHNLKFHPQPMIIR